MRLPVNEALMLGLGGHASALNAKKMRDMRRNLGLDVAFASDMVTINQSAM